MCARLGLYSALFFVCLDCGVRPLRGQGRIVGGEKSNFGDWPWQVRTKQTIFMVFKKSRKNNLKKE